MQSNTEVIQKLCTMHSDIKHTNEKVNDIDEKFEKIDIILRGNGKSIGLCAEVTKNTTICDKLKKRFEKSERKTTIIIVVVAIVVFGGAEVVRPYIMKLLFPMIP